MEVISNAKVGSVEALKLIHEQIRNRSNIGLCETGSSVEAVEIVAHRIGQAEKRIVAADGDGLDVVNIREGTQLDLASMTMQLLSTDACIESDQVEYRQASSISIRSDLRLLVSVDDVGVEQRPVCVAVCPNVLRVVSKIE